MKFSSSLSTICVLLPLLSQVAGLGVPDDGLVARQRNGQGQRGQGQRGNNRGGAAAAAAASSSAAAAAASSAAAAGGQGGQGGNAGNAAAANDGDPQKSLTLDPKVIATGFQNDGQDVPTAGQVASLTSSNNFINFCLTVPNLPITDGKQITTGSCNPAPIGVIPSVDNMPSVKFEFPQNGGTVAANQAFTIKLNAKNIQLGNFVNAKENYFAAPQTLNGQGQIIGHTHVVVEQLDSVTQTTPTNPKNFAFFKGINEAAVGGQVQADVSAGLPPAAYRACTINSSSNHQPVIVPIAQHGSLDDCVYFTATVGGAAAGGNAGGAANNGTAAAAAGGQGTNNAGAGAGAGKGGAAAASSAAAAQATAAQGGRGQGRGQGAQGQQAQGAQAGQGQQGNNRGNRGGRQANRRSPFPKSFKSRHH